MTWVEIFGRYIESKLALFSIAERCSLKGWPDRKEVLQNAFRLQQLFCERELRRVERLAATLKMSDGLHRRPTTIKAVDAMVNESWTDLQETELRQVDPRYEALAAEIEKCRAASHGAATEGPLKAAQWDPEYQKARKAAQEVVLECDRLLKSSAERLSGR
jgi:hypothetical protein